MAIIQRKWTDDEYVRGLLRQDESAIVAFISNIGPSIARNLLRSKLSHSIKNELDDVISVTTVSLFEKASQFDPRKGTFRGWVSKLAYNVGADLIGRRDCAEKYWTTHLGDRDVELASVPIPDSAANEAAGASFVKLSESERSKIIALREEVSKLPHSQRVIIEADFAASEEKECAQKLAVLLETSVGSVYALRCTAIKKLRRAMIRRGFYT